MARLGMVIDLKRCIGCHACTMACKAANSTLPGVFWARVLEKEEGRYPTIKRTYLPVLCNHCENPPCRDVCPTGATSKREDGIVFQDYDKCMGCRACIAACPYDVRFYVKKRKGYFPSGLTPYEEYGYKRYQDGVTQKCLFCYDRVEEGVEPACVEACVTNARYFGDLHDPMSQVSQLIRRRQGYQLRSEEGTDPSVYYIS